MKACDSCKNKLSINDRHKNCYRCRNQQTDVSPVEDIEIKINNRITGIENDFNNKLKEIDYENRKFRKDIENENRQFKKDIEILMEEKITKGIILLKEEIIIELSKKNRQIIDDLQSKMMTDNLNYLEITSKNIIQECNENNYQNLDKLTDNFNDKFDQIVEEGYETIDSSIKKALSKYIERLNMVEYKCKILTDDFSKIFKVPEKTNVEINDVQLNAEAQYIFDKLPI